MATIQKLISSLRLYKAGKCSLDDVRHAFETLDNFHDFAHYLDDEDIRNNDPEYKIMQDAEFDRFLEALEVGDMRTANRINFLNIKDS